MRIVAGTLRGRTLVAPKGQSTRPTADRTRQALFNVLENAPWSTGVKGARVIDLFAGSGALGLEALSRGAASCVFIESAGPAREAIAHNIASLGLAARATLGPRDAIRLPAGELFDLAFLDPPYGQGLAQSALAALGERERLVPGALAVVERGAGEPPFRTPGFTLLDQRDWGATRVSFLRWG